MDRAREALSRARAALADPEDGWKRRGVAALAAGAVLTLLGLAGVISQAMSLARAVAIGAAAIALAIGLAGRYSIGIAFLPRR